MKRAGIHKIAELAGVSIGTVDRALHGRPGIRESTRKKILAIAKQLSYTPHPAARALSIGRANLRIGVCIPEEIHFFYDQMRAGIKDEAARAGSLGIELIHKPTPSLGENEKENITQLLESKVNAMIITPGDPRVVAPLVNKAEKEGIRVVFTTTDAPQSHRSSVVGVNPSLSGKLAAELAAKFLPSESQAAVVTGMLNTEEHRAKTDGFCTAFERDCPGGKVIAVLEAHESEEESYRKTRTLLDERPKLRGLYVSTVNCIPVVRAVQERRRAGKIRLITTDLFREMIPHLEQGTISASIYQDPYQQGQTAIRILVDYLTHGTAIPKTCYLNPGIVLRSNLGLFREATRR
jgi:LacI family transcriptional regulator, galactose operon repressor